MMRKPCRVLLLTPDAGLVRAVSDTGLEAWTLRGAGTATASGGQGDVPPERTLTDEDPARTLRDMAADVRPGHGIDFVLCGGDAEPALLDVLRELGPSPARTGAWPPDKAELRRLLGEGPAPRPAAADDDPAPVCHVDTVSIGGMHLLLDIDWPDSRARFREAEWGDVRETVRGALDLIGHESGGMRTSVALTPTGPRPVEMVGTPFLVASLGAGTTR
ncbi:hypothetical protein ACFU3E_10760 [Streptomyces sp. NPDC057424]|uniref:hypothetical protein n=1 Tax=Streptomyces sp. NPDC057424 TaxID=3346127 RepID=UPI003679F938